MADLLTAIIDREMAYDRRLARMPEQTITLSARDVALLKWCLRCAAFQLDKQNAADGVRALQAKVDEQTRGIR